MKKVFITGIEGFTGSYLANSFKAKGYQVYGSSKSAKSSKDVFTCDILDTNKLSKIIQKVGPNFVVHLAANAFVNTKDVNALYNVNLLGTNSLLQAVVSANVECNKILLVSSANIYGDSSESPIDENAPINLKNHYAASKRMMEMSAELFSSLPIVIARPFNYTGLGQDNKFLIPKVVEHFKSKSPVIELGNIDVYRDFSDVRDLVSSYVRLLESEADSGIFNFCSGKETSIKEVISILEDISQHKVEVKINPEFVRENEIKSLVGCENKLRAVIGDTSKHSLKETLEWMYLN
ncbi:GDP-mannose 4,6-dehydratase [Colwelliaceae bacterium 6441]